MLLPRSVAVLTGLLLVAGPARAGLDEYIRKPEPVYAWKLKEKHESADGTIYDLHLVSQAWQGITWEHQLQVYQPKGVTPNGTMFLWNTGGHANPRDIGLALELARKIKAPCAFVYGIPNQPLLGGKKEDGLIAETFVRFLETKDENWPLLFPMAKSVVKAMDALQDFSKQEWKQPVQGFIVSGGSKRGWTSWLAAAADPRVKAIAPCVIDTLNMPAQMPHQKESFGRYSLMIHEYVKTGLVPMPQTPEAKRLWGMVDPYVYRDRLTLPKFIINGNNDDYWAVDALNLYWDDLKGDKWVMYVPNARHNLQQLGPDGQADRTRAVNGLAAFARSQVADKPLPKLTWRHDDADGKMRLTVEASDAPLKARLWVAESENRDFRLSKWEERPAACDKCKVIGEVTPPKQGCLAFYGELEYEIDGIRYQLSTQVRVAGKPLPVKD